MKQIKASLPQDDKEEKLMYLRFESGKIEEKIRKIVWMKNDKLMIV